MTAASPAAAAAESVGASDAFVLRRISGPRFVHLGGSGRGEGWAGIVEVSTDDEPPLAEALRADRPVRLEPGESELVFGPYYARAAVLVPLLPDVVVVFGGDDHLGAGDDTLRAAARRVSESVDVVGDAKRLSDDLEQLEAVQAALLVPPLPVADAMYSLADAVAAALSCEVGALYLTAGDRVAIANRGWTLETSEAEVAAALREAVEHGEFPFCVQDARSAPLPGALGDEEGIRSYYLLELTGAAKGALLVAHTDAAPRGFTMLCRRLGLQVAAAVSAVLGVGVTQEWTAAEAARLHAAFADLER